MGKNLVEHLSGTSGKYSVSAFLRAELDLMDPAAVSAKFQACRPEVVIHCASVGGSRGTGYQDTSGEVVYRNLAMFFNVERALPEGTRLISFGSGAEYDRRAYKPKMPESYFDSSVPADPYGYSKYLISKYIARDPRIVSLRIFGLYGKYEDYRFKFISNAVVKNLLGLPIRINQNVLFDYLWIGDFLRIVERFVAEDPPERAYNLTPDSPVSLLELAGIVAGTAAAHSGIEVINAGMNAEYSGENSRLRGFLGPFDFTPHSKAIPLLREYYSGAMETLDKAAVREDKFLNYCRTKPA